MELPTTWNHDITVILADISVMKEEEEEDGSEAEEEDNDIEETEEYEEEEDEETSGYPPQLEIVRAPEQQASKCSQFGT